MISSSSSAEHKAEDILLEATHSQEKVHAESTRSDTVASATAPEGGYRLYRRRFAGLAALVLLNIAAGMAWTWFGPISNNVAADFNITLDQVNWLGNILSALYLPAAVLIPSIVSKWGIRRCTEIGAVALILASWIRYAGTATSLSPKGAYALLFFGQIFASIAQPMYQCLGTKYSETWFDTQGRTTATMVVAIANPVGSGVAQLISPIIVDTRKSILLLSCIGTAVTPLIFLIQNAPPTPPTHAASKPPVSLRALLYSMAGRPPTPELAMTIRERLDFAIITFVFGVLVAAASNFSILTNQILAPVGYNPEQSGFLGACLLLTGIVAAVVTAPLFDRVFTYHLALTSKICAPVTAIGWFALIWAVKPNNIAGLFVLMTVIGVTSLTILPVALELACEVTGNADASSVVLWSVGNVGALMFVLSQQALRAGPDADPPFNMKRSLIFNGVFSLVAGFTNLMLKGEQKRKRLDEKKRALALSFPVRVGAEA